MWERISDAYRVQEEMMPVQEAIQFTQSPKPYNTTQQQYNTMQQPYNKTQPQYNTTQPQYNTVKYDQAFHYNMSRGDRARYKGGGKSRGGFGRGRGPVVCHNCQQPGHYARECALSPVTCIYCCA